MGYTLQVLQDIAAQQNEILRQQYKDSLEHLLRHDKNPRKLIFIDKTHKDCHASRQRKGWGKRNSGGLIINRWFIDEVRYTMIAAANIDGFVFETCANYYRSEESNEGASGNVGQEQFKNLIRHYLVPVLGKYKKNKDNSIVVMDNASTHTSFEVSNMITYNKAIDLMLDCT